MLTCFSIDVSCGCSVQYLIALNHFKQATQDAGHLAEETLCPKFECSTLEKKMPKIPKVGLGNIC